MEQAIQHELIRIQKYSEAIRALCIYHEVFEDVRHEFARCVDHLEHSVKLMQTGTQDQAQKELNKAAGVLDKILARYIEACDPRSSRN